MNTTKLSISDYIFLLIVFIGFYLLYRFSIFTGDDYYYCFIGGICGGINGEFIPVDSFADAIKSNVYDYMHWNGRFLIHTLTSYFCGVVGVDVFRILNSIVFVLLITGLIKLFRNEFVYNKTDKYIILFLLFIFMPVPGLIFLGHIAFVTNYLWTSCAIVYFILLYNKIKDEKNYNTGINILLLILGVIVGSLQESFTIGVSGALFFYYCFNFKKFRGSTAWLVIGFWIGTCIVTLAPGNFVRLSITSSNKDSNILNIIQNYIYIALNFKLLHILILSCIFLYIKEKEFLIKFLKKNQFYFLSILFNTIIVAIVYAGMRQLTCIELFSMILLLKMIYSYFHVLCKIKSIIINISISCLLILLYIPIYKDRQINQQKYVKLQNTKVENGIIIDNDIYYSLIKDNKFTSNYTFYPLHDCNNIFYKKGLSLLKSNGKCPNYIKTILPLSPEEIDKKFNNKSSEYVYDEKNMVYYFRANKKRTIENIYMYSSPFTFLGEIRLFLSKEKYRKTNIFGYLPEFQYNDYNYYIYDNKEKCKVYDFKVNYKD